ncbi:NAD(P)H-binding protein [Streptomyces phaeochromogenes]|uniref:NAD(P)H-binding protein n=1 Tax=Streptomyces phaeochromogenes TaxID=1923 RepID=A0ABZ1H9Y7_STRPH|nr:NAD(P)H-binding protein [Streptomyces phaeochromogenes]WSD14366.1 NAD(P)H-binding protein [Streptomyces phaeochromogenes]
MSEKTGITDVLMIGGTGSIGRHVSAVLEQHGLRRRALVRNPARAESQLTGVDLIPGNLDDLDALRRAVRGADAVVLTHGAGGDREHVDYGGVRNLLQVLDGARPRLALMTSIYSTRDDIPGNDWWKLRSERLVRASGLPYTVVRPGWFDHAGPTQRRLVFTEGGRPEGGIARVQIAETLVASLLTGSATGKTLAVVATEGPRQDDWDGLFGALHGDIPGALDGYGDPTVAPLTEEPADVRADLKSAAA